MEGGFMIDRNLEEKADKGLKNLNFIWVAMLGFLALYTFLGFFLKNSLEITTRDPSFHTTLKWTLYLVSAATFFLALFLRRMLINSSRTLKGWTQEATGQPHPAVARYSTAVVLSLAVAESIGVYGLILCLFFHNLTDLISLIALSAVAMILLRPKRDELFGLMKAKPTS
jgi:hypothetical protein